MTQLRFLTLASFCLGAVVFSFLLHEFSHWLMGEALGYDMRMTLNKVYPVAGRYEHDWHYAVISAVGPLITMLQAFVAYRLLQRVHHRGLFPFLFTCFYLELLSGIVSIRNPNDLVRIGGFLNIGTFTLPALFVVVYIWLLYDTIKREQYSRLFVGQTFGWILFFSSVWILTNQQFRIILL
jgi:hypothetical protein